MSNEYGSDFITIQDEDGAEYVLEILSTLEYNGFTYLAVVPAGEQTMSLSSPGCMPVSRTILALPSTACAAKE